jgi:alpha-glucosidase
MRSWLDTDGDGDGDIPGQAGLAVVARRRRDLPVADRASPDQDWGYDVCDYYGVHPDPGTLDDLDELIARAGKLGIKVPLHLATPRSRRAWGRASCMS